MDGLVNEGVTDFKLFTAYPGVFFSDDGAIFRAMQQTEKNGGLILMHAENGLAIDVVAEQSVAAGKTDPYYHGVVRYPIFEGEATHRVIRLAEAAGVPVYIVHLSASDALDEVRAARDRGTPAFAETCPQYLFLSLEDLGNGFEGAKFVCSPPLRPAARAARAVADCARSSAICSSMDFAFARAAAVSARVASSWACSASTSTDRSTLRTRSRSTCSCLRIMNSSTTNTRTSSGIFANKRSIKTKTNSPIFFYSKS